MGESRVLESFVLCLSGGRSLRLARETLERPLLPDRTDAVSAALSPPDSPFERMAEFLGLSVFPGILDRRDLNDRDESFVSERLKDGRDWRAPSPELEEPPSLEA